MENNNHIATAQEVYDCIADSLDRTFDDFTITIIPSPPGEIWTIIEEA